jgi:hypothetical protein
MLQNKEVKRICFVWLEVAPGRLIIVEDNGHSGLGGVARTNADMARVEPNV